MQTNATTLQLLTIAEAAAVLRISVAPARRLIAAGELPAHRVGGQFRVNAAELRALLENDHEETGA